MSTIGVGAAAVGGGGALLIGAAIGAAVVGTGVLVARGVMWCGEKIEQNYQATCQEWADLNQRARAESRANVQEMGMYLTNQLEHMTIDAYLALDKAAPTAQPVIKQQDLLNALARMRTAQEDARQAISQQSDSEKALLSARLRAEIKMGQDVLPPQVIAEAKQAIRATPASIYAALQQIEAAWAKVTVKETRQSRAIQKTQQALAVTSSQLSAIDTLLRNTANVTPAAEHARYKEQKHDLEHQLMEAQDLLGTGDVVQAAKLVETIRQSIEPLMVAISSGTLKAWEQFRTVVNTQLGNLAALTTMVKEAQAIKLVEPAALINLEQRLGAAQKEANKLLQSGDAYQQERLRQLHHRVALLKEDVFMEVTMSQQRQIAQTIQSTLNELDFASDTGEQATLQRNGDMLYVEVMVAKGDATGRDDKVIAFDVARDGQISYDFSGYTGSSCIKDAKIVFSALHDKGLFILDDDALEALERLPVEQQTASTLRQEQFQTKLVQNKTQAQLAETLKGVLKKMGYPHLYESSVGGFIELEAFQGSVGYRVILSPEGEARVLKDAGQIDVTQDMRDLVATSAQAVQKEIVEPAKKKKKARTTRSRTQNMLS